MPVTYTLKLQSTTGWPLAKKVSCIVD